MEPEQKERRIIAPWNNQQIANLLERQICGVLHEYTCPSCHPCCSKRNWEVDILAPTADGWYCPVCDKIVQDWAYAEDANGEFKVAVRNILTKLGRYYERGLVDPCPHRLRTGDHVWITCQGRKVEGTIALASTNEKSLMLSFETMLDGHVGMMPVLMGDDGVYRSIINNVPVTIAPFLMN